jgi:hypothetical protein
MPCAINCVSRDGPINRISKINGLTRAEIGGIIEVDILLDEPRSCRNNYPTHASA